MEQGRIWYAANGKVGFIDSNGIEVDITNGFPHKKYHAMKSEIEERKNSQRYHLISMNIMKDPVQEELNRMEKNSRVIVKPGEELKNLGSIF